MSSADRFLSVLGYVDEASFGHIFNWPVLGYS